MHGANRNPLAASRLQLETRLRTAYVCTVCIGDPGKTPEFCWQANRTFGTQGIDGKELLGLAETRLRAREGPGTNLDQAPLTRCIGSTRSGERRKA